MWPYRASLGTLRGWLPMAVVAWIAGWELIRPRPARSLSDTILLGFEQLLDLGHRLLRGQRPPGGLARGRLGGRLGYGLARSHLGGRLARSGLPGDLFDGRFPHGL